MAGLARRLTASPSRDRPDPEGRQYHRSVEIAIKILTVVGLGALELWAAVPAGVALGLHPILTAMSAAVGAVLAILVVLVLGARARAWLGRRHPSMSSSHRSLRTIWTRYGVAGLGLAAPLLVGAPLGTVLGLLLGAQPSHLFRWMVLGVVGWSALLTLATVAGLVGLESLG